MLIFDHFPYSSVLNDPLRENIPRNVLNVHVLKVRSRCFFEMFVFPSECGLSSCSQFAGNVGPIQIFA